MKFREYIQESKDFKIGDRVKSTLDNREGTIVLDSGQAGSTQVVVKFDKPLRKQKGYETETILKKLLIKIK